MKKWILYGLSAGAGLLLLAILIALASESRQRVQMMGEFVPQDEAAYTTAIIQSAIEMVNASRQKNADSKVFRRDVHAKTHGCLAATFSVRPLENRLRHGLFAQPGQYKSWIRFSSGDTLVQKDAKGDARGMAIKVMGVPGEKLLDAERNAQTQDFIMINSPTFFIQTLAEYADFTQALGRGDKFGYFFGGWSLNPAKWKLRQMWLGLSTLKGAPESLLDTRFFSLSAYKLGPGLNVKYSARPCKAIAVPDHSRSDPDYLRKVMQTQLDRGDACFDFMVQLQVPGKDMPVEDVTVEWKEKDSPFISLAQIEITKQKFDSPAQQTFCDNLGFNPWHALPAHRPVGALNRIRKAVYQEDGRYRRCKNGVSFAEPRDWSLELEGKPCEIPVSSAAARTTE
jgi:catalase